MSALGLLDASLLTMATKAMMTTARIPMSRTGGLLLDGGWGGRLRLRSWIGPGWLLMVFFPTRER